MPGGAWLRGSASPSSAVPFSQAAFAARGRAARLATDALGARIAVLRSETQRRVQLAANPLFHHRNSHKTVACLSAEEPDDAAALSGATQSESASENSEHAGLTLPNSRATGGPSPSGTPCFLTLSSLRDAAQTIATQWSMPLRSPRAPPRTRSARVRLTA